MILRLRYAGMAVRDMVMYTLRTGRWWVPVLVVVGRGEVLVPFVDAICRRVDPEARVIEIDPPDGLIALNSARV